MRSAGRNVCTCVYSKEALQFACESTFSNLSIYVSPFLSHHSRIRPSHSSPFQTPSDRHDFTNTFVHIHYKLQNIELITNANIFIERVHWCYNFTCRNKAIYIHVHTICEEHTLCISGRASKQAGISIAYLSYCACKQK